MSEPDLVISDDDDDNYDATALAAGLAASRAVGAALPARRPGQGSSRGDTKRDRTDAAGPAPKRKSVETNKGDYDSRKDPPPPPTPHCTTERAAMRFWSGSVVNVSNCKHPDDSISPSPSLSFADMIGPVEELELALVSTFCIDHDWVLSHFVAHQHVRVLLVIGTPNDPRCRPGIYKRPGEWDVRQLYTEYGTSVNGKPLPRSLMHIKLNMYYYKSFLRIAIPTANAVPGDWSRMDNAMFIQDFPRRIHGYRLESSHNNPTHSDGFSLAILNLMYRLGVPQRWLNPMLHFDFSESDHRDSARVVFSHSGDYRGYKAMASAGGLDSLARAVKSCGFIGDGEWEIEAAGSSIGNYNVEWLAATLEATSGKTPIDYLTPDYATRGHPVAMHQLPIKIVFPTLEEVQRSDFGTKGGSTIYSTFAHWIAPTFPRRLFHQNKNRRRGIISHTKTLLAFCKPRSGPSTPTQHEAWFYIGSHNFSQAAWGKLSYTKTGEQAGARLELGNTELGVLLPLRAGSALGLQERASSLVGYTRPLVRYPSSQEVTPSSSYLSFPGTEVPWEQFQWREETEAGKVKGKGREKR